jgi:hypothetical protein
MLNNVMKMLSPEEMTLLGQLKALVEEILSLQGADSAGQAPTEDSGQILESLRNIENALSPKDEENQDEMKKSKDTIEKENAGPTANENADERLKPETDINNKNMAEVGKMLMNMLSKQSNVKKSNNTDINIITQAIQKALNPIVQKIESIEEFNSNVLDALGISAEVEKSINLPDTQTVNKGMINSGNIPVQTPDATAVVNMLVEKMQELSDNKKTQNIQNDNDWNGMQNIRKHLAEAQTYIFKNNLENR